MQYRSARDSDFDRFDEFLRRTPHYAVERNLGAERGKIEPAAETEVAAVRSALQSPAHSVIVAWNEQRGELAGLTVLNRSGRGPVIVEQFLAQDTGWTSGLTEELWLTAQDDIAANRGALIALPFDRQPAIDFFTNQGFENTGEGVGDYADDRILFLLEPEALEVEESSLASDDDFPSAADEPYLEPVYAELPDYQLAAEELTSDIRFDPETTSLDQQQISQVEDFIARAKRQKQEQRSAGKAAAEPTGQTRPTGRHPHIEFEVEYGAGSKPKGSSLDFEFAFEDTPSPAPGAKTETREAEEDADFLDLKDLSDVPADVTPAELRAEFEDQLGGRLTDYFGAEDLPRYLTVYRNAENFHHIRDVSLHGLSRWINGRPPGGEIERRKRRVLGELIEYFIVEPGAAIHDGRFPQKVLRYQGAEWDKVDLFKMVMDYLDFRAVSEQVYTDFVAIPPKVLKRATDNYLQTSKDERLFFICDQSLFGSGKQGFAMTDAGIYWKNVLQPAGAATYTTLRTISLKDDHLLIDGQYFDAGPELNLQLALLLDKLRRLDPPK